MAKFVLVLRDSGWNPEEMSPEEIQSVIGRYRAWSEKIRSNGGQKLRDNEGRVLRRDAARISVTDGPYAEAKEILGGFMVIEAATYDEAQRLCEDSPHFDYGSIEIRQIDAP